MGSFRAVSLVALAALAGAVTSAEAGGCRGSACYTLVSTPPVYGSVAEQVQVRPSQSIPRVIPAEYDYVTEQVLIQPARQVARHVPGIYDTVTEKVLISAATRRWDVSYDAHGRAVGCWVDVPAQYGVQQRRVEVSPPSTRYETIPAVYGQTSRKVMIRATQVVHEHIPAVYETRHRQVLVSPGTQGWAPTGRY